MPPRLAGAAVTQHDRSAIALTNSSRGPGRDVLPDVLLGWINALPASPLQAAVSSARQCRAQRSTRLHSSRAVPPSMGLNSMSGMTGKQPTHARRGEGCSPDPWSACQRDILGFAPSLPSDRTLVLSQVRRNTL